MHVTNLYVYPLKGAAPIPLDSARLDAFGIAYDRRWMAVDATGRFLTAREHPRLLQLGTALSEDALHVRSAAAGELRVPIRHTSAAESTVRVWHDVVAAHDEGDDAAAFISAHLAFDARLVFMPDSTLRQADTDYARTGDRVSFADGFPLLLAGQASLDEINRRIDEPIPMLRFRPNIVVDTTAPHEEDTWRRITIGNIACDVVKPCARCVVTTIDPATLVAGREPLRSLAAYRNWNGKVWFAQNVVHRALGVISVGDEVAVIDASAARPPLAVPVVN